MLRLFASITFVLAVLATPVALAAEGPPTVPGHWLAAREAAGETVNSTDVPVAHWDAIGSASDPDGVTASDTCGPDSCGERGAMTDADGLTAPATEIPGRFGQFLLWLRVLLPF